MKKFLIIICFIFLLLGCDSNSIDINKLMQENEYIIIDVRTKEEYDEIHIKDAINIPYNELTDTFDKNKIIFVYCKSGNRSRQAYNSLKSFGYEVYDLGGISSINLEKE